MYNSSYYHHQIVSIYFSHCCHIFRGCVPEVVVPSYVGSFIYKYPGKAGLPIFYYCAVLWCAQIIKYIITWWPQSFCLHIALPHYDPSEGIELLNCLSGTFCIECVSTIKLIISVIFHAIYGTVYSAYQFLLWWLCTLSYYHNQIRSMTHLPFCRVKPWTNGMRCISFYIIMSIFCATIYS